MVNNTMIGALRIEATLESGKFVEGTKKLKSAANDAEKGVKKSFDGIAASSDKAGRSFTKLGTAGSSALGGLAAGLSIGLLTAAVKKSLDYAASLKTVSEQAGVTSTELQTLRYAATQNGLTTAQLDDGLTKLKESMGKVAAGASAQTKAFAALGISAKELSGLDTAEVFKMVADKLAAIPDPAKRAAFELAIFGESGSKLDGLLSKGSGAINTLAQAAQDLGVVLSDSQIQNADQTAAKLDQVKMVLAAQISGVVADNASSIVSLAGALSQLTSSIVNFLGSNPTAAVAILGALAGGRVGGLPGAALGALAGANAGLSMARNKELANTDLKTRVAALRKAQAEYRAAKKIPGAAGSMATTETGKRLRQEIDATNRARAVYAASKNAPATGGAIPQFLAPAGPKPRKSGGGGSTRKGPRDRSDDVTFQSEQELRRADMDVLRAKQSLAHGAAAQAELSLQMLDLEKEMFDAEQAHKVDKAKRDFAEGRITQDALNEVIASSEKLKLKYAEKDRLERQAVRDELAEKIDQDTFELESQKRQFKIDDLHAAMDMAETARERRDIGQQILDAEIEQKRLALEHEKLLAIRNGATAQEIAAIQDRINHLSAERAQGAAANNRATQGPLESYLNGLPTTAAKWEEALQQVKVNGLDALTQGIMDTITGVESLGQAFKKVAQQIIADLLRIYIQKTLISALGNLLMPGGGGIAAGAGAGAIGSGAGIFGAATRPSFASGGSFNILGNHGVDKNVLSLNGLPIANVSHGERIDVGTGNSGGGMMGGSPTFNFYGNNVDGRKTGLQAAAAYRAEMARSSKRGY